MERKFFDIYEICKISKNKLSLKTFNYYLIIIISHEKFKYQIQNM